MALKPGAWAGWGALLAVLGGAVWWAQTAPHAPAVPAPLHSQPAAAAAAAAGSAGSAALAVDALVSAPAAPAHPAPPAAPSLDGAGCLRPAPAVPKAPPPPHHLSGRLGLWVAEVDPRTLGVIRAVGTNPGSTFPLASTYKQAVLWALLQEFDAGRISPTERMDVTPGSQSLGEYPYDGSSVRTLSERMIRNSDNTATDLLHRRIGLARVQQVAGDLGLCHTRVMMPTKDWWVMQSGLSETYRARPDWWEAQGRARLTLAARIDEETRQYGPDDVSAASNTYFEQRHQPQDDLGAHNVSTPYEWATLLSHEYLRSGLSARGQGWLEDVARLGYGKAGLKAGQVGNIAVFYGKGGNGWRLLTYSGYFQTKDGHHVVYAFMQHGADQWYTMPNTYRAFAWINAAVDEVIGPQRPPVPTLPPTPVPPPASGSPAVPGSSGSPQPLVPARL